MPLLSKYLEEHMLVRDLMSMPAVTIRSNEDYKAALTLMQEKSLHHLPVMDSDGELSGIAAERDLLIAATHYLQSPVEVGDVMHRGVVAVTPDTTAAKAAKLMVGQRIGSLPVVNGAGQVVGIVTETDLLRAFAATAQAT
jgi:CBS-domain-containing membrane protein